MKISAAAFAGEKSSHGGRNKALQGMESRRFMVKTAKGSDTFGEVFYSDAQVLNHADFGLPVMQTAFCVSVMQDSCRTGLIIRLINEFISRSCLMV